MANTSLAETAKAPETPEQKEIARLQRLLTNERSTSEGLLNRLKEAELAIEEFKGLISKFDAKDAELNYVLSPIAPKSTCHRYDGLAEDGVFIWHEALYFTWDTGYDATVLRDRIAASVKRAVGEDSYDRIAPDFSNLPPFDSRNALEVIIRMKIHEDDPESE